MQIRGMLEALRKHWREFDQAAPGRRVQERYQRQNRRRRSWLWKPLVIAAGFLILLVGVFLMAVPGPGLLIAALGAGLMAEESRLAAAALDRVEVGSRRVAAQLLQAWNRASLVVRAVILLLVGAGAAAGAWIAYLVFIHTHAT